MRAKPFYFGHHRLEPGTRREARLKVSESYTAEPVEILVNILHGTRPGPTLFVSAAIHGNELNGIEIVRRLAWKVDARRLRGTLLCIPVLNPFGFARLSRALPDGRDLNRSFPGRPDGTLGEQFAHHVFTQLVRKSDYGIDLHTATQGRVNLPHIRADMTVPGVRRLAYAFAPEIIYNFKGASGSLRRAAVRAGIPTIVLETGSQLRFQDRLIRDGVEGVLRVLRGLRMIEPGPAAKPAFQVVVDTATWVRGERGGILVLGARPGDVVRKGDVLASISRPFGRETWPVVAPHSGLVISTTNIPVALPGAAVCHLLKLGPQLRAVERSLLLRAREGAREIET